MPTLELYGAAPSNYVWAVRMACEEKGVPYELKMARPHTPEINAIHPFGKMPAMRHGDLKLAESKAIATYIDRAFDGPKLIPDEPVAAAEVEQWVSIVNTIIDPAMIRTYAASYVFPRTPDKSPDRKAIDGVLPTIDKQLSVLDQAVASGFLAAGRFTLADIVLMPILYYLQKFPEGAEMFSKTKYLPAYFAKHAVRPAFIATTPPPMPGR